MSSRIEGFSLFFGASELARMLMPKHKPLPKVELVMTDADTARLYVDGRCASQGSLSEATTIMRQVGYRPVSTQW